MAKYQTMRADRRAELERLMIEARFLDIWRRVDPTARVAIDAEVEGVVRRIARLLDQSEAT